MSRAYRIRRSLRRRLSRLAMAGAAIGLSLASQFGCGREFFRHWADQDVSEAVFEKSRDPRWRLDRFSIEPPAMSRFAQPYNPDRQPAPPDDPAAKALSPTPQFPYFSLQVPAEGTGYQDILNRGNRYVTPPSDPVLETPVAPVYEPPPGYVPPPDSGTPTPFEPGRNPGPDLERMTPNSPAGGGVAPGANPAVPPTTPPEARSKPRPKDKGVLLTAFQAPGTVPPQPGDAPGAVTPGRVQDPLARPGQRPDVTPDGSRPRPAQERLQPVETPLVPSSRDPVDPNAPPVIFPEPGREPLDDNQKKLLEILNPVLRNFNEATAAGFPPESRPYIVTPAEALHLGLMNSRAYQFRLENVYVQALAVTLSRFGFQPNFYAGFGPVTGGSNGGGFAQNFGNSFNYRTRETGSPTSVLNIGAAAGMTKVLSFGGRLAMGFANQTVFNFLGNNPSQPTVTSFLPITFSQSFLQGGGRAVTLENLTQAERTLLYEVRSFARFRQSVVPTFLMANQQFSEGQGQVSDPTVGYLAVLLQLQRVENDRRTVVAFEQLLKLYQEYVRGGASSGISQIQVDQVANQLQSVQVQLLGDEATLKSLMDQYRMSLGLPPDLPLILDRAPLAAFRRVFITLDEWAATPKHDPFDLDGILEGLPELESIVIDGRELFKYDGTKLIQVYGDLSKQQEFLLAGERVALENRLDLMNARAILYDTWRQLAVRANGLQGVFDVSINHNITTVPGNTNPLAFVDQAKQFQVQFNTELPLVRVAERNQYKLAQITYIRQQRVLQSAEDNIKLGIRQQIYNLIQLAASYEIQRRNLLINVRQRDLSLQNIIAPPSTTDAAANAAQQANQTNNLISGIQNILNTEQTLIQQWVQFQSTRLALYRDLGLMPYDEWEAFYEFFPSGSEPGLLNDANRGGGGGPAAAGPAVAPPPGRP